MKFEDLEFERKLYFRRAMVQVRPGLVASVIYDEMMEKALGPENLVVDIFLEAGDKTLDIREPITVRGVGDDAFKVHLGKVKRVDVGRWLDLLSRPDTSPMRVLAQAAHEGVLRLAKPSPTHTPVFDSDHMVW